MKPNVTQLNFVYLGGSATAKIYGPTPANAFDRRPHLAIHISFTVHSDRPNFEQATQDLVSLPVATATPYLRVEFLSDSPM